MAINPIANKSNDSVATGASTGKKIKPDNVPEQVGSESMGDKIDITEVAQRIKDSFRSSSPAEVIDQEKIAAVRKALQNGSYQINAESIAKKMLQIDRRLDST